MVRYAGINGLVHKQSSNFVQSDETGVLSEPISSVFNSYYRQQFKGGGDPEIFKR